MSINIVVWFMLKAAGSAPHSSLLTTMVLTSAAVGVDDAVQSSVGPFLSWFLGVLAPLCFFGLQVSNSRSIELCTVQ
jgi:hypothetical protein